MSDKELLLFGILGLIAFLLFILIFLVIRNSYKNSDNNSNKLIQNQIFNLSKIMDDKLNKNFSISSQISQNSNILIENITKKLTNLEETNKQIKDI